MDKIILPIVLLIGGIIVLIVGLSSSSKDSQDIGEMFGLLMVIGALIWYYIASRNKNK